MMLDIERFEAIGGQAATVATRARPSELGQMAKAHPAASLINPGWRCSKCRHLNPITEPFCEKCPE